MELSYSTVRTGERECDAKPLAKATPLDQPRSTLTDASLRQRLAKDPDACKTIQEQVLTPIREAILGGGLQADEAIEMLLSMAVAAEAEIYMLKSAKLQGTLLRPDVRFGNSEPTYHVDRDALDGVRKSGEHLARSSISLAKFKALTAGRRLTEARTAAVREAKSGGVETRSAP